MAGEPLLKVEGVETYYGNIRALAGVNIEVQKGEYLSEDDIIRYDDIYGRV